MGPAEDGCMNQVAVGDRPTSSSLAGAWNLVIHALMKRNLPD